MSEVQAQWAVIYDRLDKLEDGEVAPYAELQALLPDTLWKGVVAAFHQARKRFLEQGIDFENVRGQGYRRVSTKKPAKAGKGTERAAARKAISAPVKEKTVAADPATKAVSFNAGTTQASVKSVKPTYAQRLEALETQVEFLTERLEEVRTRASKPATQPAGRPRSPRRG